MAAYQQLSPFLVRQSPHLAQSLRIDLPGVILERTSEVLQYALAHGGSTELDFERPEGASYNPRPARVALILLGDARVRDIATIDAGILASIVQNPEDLFSLRVAFPDISDLCENVLSHPEEILQSIEHPLMRKTALIQSAIFLDRVRHLHQAQGDVEKLWQEQLSRADGQIALARVVSARLATILEAWKRRFETMTLPRMLEVR